MGVRIYKLAKELKVDSKRLVEICPKVGISGKGSALASLTEEEADKVKSYLQGGGERSKAAAPSDKKTVSEPMRKEDYLPPGGTKSGKPPVIGESRKKAEPKEKPEPKPSEAAAEAAEPKAPKPSGPLKSRVAAATEGKSAPQKQTDKEEPPSKSKVAPLERKESVDKSKTGAVPEIKSKARPPAKPIKKKTAESKPSPSIHLAPIPDAPKAKKQPEKKSEEPAPQQPEIRLTPDVLKARSSGAGSQPLNERIKEMAEKKKRAEGKKTPVDFEKEDAAVLKGKNKRGGGDPLLEGRLGRQLKRKQQQRRRAKKQFDDDSPSPGRKRRLTRRGGVSTAAPRKSSIVVELPATIRTFSEALGIPSSQVLMKLMQLGQQAMNINSEIDYETAELLAEEFEVDVEFRLPVDVEEEVISEIESREDAPEDLEPRAPVVTFLGHVDHGKTSLLDKIIGIDVVSGESGGITQHIRAYKVQHGDHEVCFVDTPGHEAFTEMRARGAVVTDIAILVVAADDGVKPQTEEAISHIKAAEVPIVVALNKIDLPGVDPQRTFQDLAANELVPAEWGGETEVVKTSAITGEGIDNLLEMIGTVAELHELKANPNKPAFGTCLEAEMQGERGVVAKFLVQDGTLRTGDVLVCGTGYGRVKAMYDTLNPREQHAEAGPSMPINLTGLDEAPGAGERFYVLDDITKAREIAESRREARHMETIGSVSPQHITLENLADALEQKQISTLNLIIRADVQGSIEAIRKELEKLRNDEVQIKILQATVGGITEADVHLADASDAIIVGFRVVEDEGARSLARNKGVQIRRYDVIYEITEHIKQALERRLTPEERTVELGRALVQKTFSISRIGTIAGCRIISGLAQRDSRVRVIREQRVIGDYPLDSLKREKDDAREVREGYECGIRLGGFNDVKEGDILEIYKTEEVARTL